MSGQRQDALIKGACGRCPQCGGRNLFRTRFRLHSSCPDCGLPLDSEDGWSLGAVPLSYSITGVGWILPLALCHIAGWIPLAPALVLAGVGCLVLPVLTFRFSKTLWAGIYYAVLPHELEAARDPLKKSSPR